MHRPRKNNSAIPRTLSWMEHFVLKYDIIKKIRIRGVFVHVKKCAVFLLLQLNTLYIFPRKKISHKVNKRKKKSKTKKLNILKSLVVKFHMKIPMLSSVKVLVVSMFIKIFSTGWRRTL